MKIFEAQKAMRGRTSVYNAWK